MTVLERKVFERWQCWKESFRRWNCWKGKCSKDESVGKESVRNMTVFEKKVFERRQCWKGNYSKDHIVGMDSVRKMSVLERKVFERWQCWKGKCSKDESAGKECVRNMTLLKRKMFERRQCWNGQCSKDVRVGKESVAKITVLERKVLWNDGVWKKIVGKELFEELHEICPLQMKETYTLKRKVFDRWQCWKGKCSKDNSGGKLKCSKDDSDGNFKCSKDEGCWKEIVWRNMPSSNEGDVYMKGYSLNTIGSTWTLIWRSLYSLEGRTLYIMSGVYMKSPPLGGLWGKACACKDEGGGTCQEFLSSLSIRRG